MTNNKYIIVLRHGPTNSNETINYNRFVEFIADMVVYLNKFLLEKGLDINHITPKVYTSPYTRCVDTGKLITSYLQVLRNNKKISVKTDTGIKRWDMKNESRQESKDRAYKYGNQVYKKVNSGSDEVYIYISHSSIIPGFISGLVGKKLKKIKLHTACLSIINGTTRELEVLNKSFN